MQLSANPTHAADAFKAPIKRKMIFQLVIQVAESYYH